MSVGWSLWVVGLILLNLGIVTFLFFFATSVEIPTEKDGTSGHQWAHGVLREGVRKLPTWWYLASVGTFLFTVAYFILYPGFGNYAGKLGWTSDQELAQEQELHNEKLAPLMERTRTLGIDELAQDQQIMHIGQVLYTDNCAACHGSNAKGNQIIGAPDLTANAWLYGGSNEAILTSIRDGRQGIMPGWKQLGYGRYKNLAHYVRSLSGDSHDAEAARVAADDFQENCIACHGAVGQGNALLGAPDLTDKHSLYGNSLEQVMHSIRDGRSGVMPAWKERLSEAEIRILTAWVRANVSNEADTGK